MGTIALESPHADLLQLIARQVSDVPMLPQVVTRLLSIIGDNDHSMQEVVKIVETDSALTARILRIANTAAFYRGNEINSVAKAIMHLGEKLVAGIAIGSCAENVFKQPLDGYESGEGELWDHSLRTAIASREIAARYSKNVSTDLAFTAGLLHDIGKSIISEFLKGNVEEMTRFCDNGNYEDFVAAEIDRVGTDHSMVGYSLAMHWGLPQAICATIRYHHRPGDADRNDQELIYVVHLGDLLAMMGGTGTGADSLSYKVNPGYETYLQLDQDDISNLMLTIQDEFTRTKEDIFADY